MTYNWIERLRAASSQAERDELLLRDWRDLMKMLTLRTSRDHDLVQDVEDQIRALADLAFKQER